MSTESQRPDLPRRDGTLRRLSRPVAAGLIAFAALTVAMLQSQPVQAQYQWVDPTGQMVYSDLPPPPGTDPSKILRRPEQRDAALKRDAQGNPIPGPAQTADATDAASASATKANDPAKAGKPAMASLADQELAFRKRMLERADAEKKKYAEGMEKAKTAKACEDARSNLRQLESGVPVTRVRADGQREVLGDDDRNERMNTIRKDLSGRC